jgi:hypothetical protein
MESDNAKMSAFLEVEVFKFGVTNVVVVELPCFMNVVSDSGDSVRGPRLAVALVSPGVVRF